MNIFFIPSWYPSKKNPISGHFIKNQALALGKSKNIQIAISLWGDESTKLNFEHPDEILSHLENYFRGREFQKKIAPRVFEFNKPVLEWSPRFLKGNIKSIIKANFFNYQKAQEKLGKINLIHAHVGFPAGFVAMKLAQKYSVPYIITEHMGPFPLAPFWGNQKLLPLVLEPLKNANQVVSVSQKLQQELWKFKIKSKVIANIIDEKFFVAGLPKTSPNFTFFSLGDICPEKGFGDLLQAMAILKTKGYKNIKLRIGGRGKYLSKYQKAAKKLAIDQNISWLGFLTSIQVLRELKNSKAFIMLSYHESFGLVLLEALACGRPIIATRSGGGQNFVTKDNGLMVEAGNISAIARSMIDLKNNYHHYNWRQIRRDVLSKYSSKIISQEIIKLYRDVV